MKNNRLLIAGGIGALGLGVVGTLFFVTSDIGKEPLVKTKEPVAIEAQVEKTETKVKPTTKETVEVERVMTSYTEMISPVGYGEKEFPKEQSATLKEKLLEYAEGGEVDMLLKEMEKNLESYRFSEGINLEIAGIYYDASFTRGLVGKTESEMRELVPNTYKTPEMLALMPLYLPETARRDAIRDILSLTPLAEGPWNIVNHSYITTREQADEDEAYADNGVAISMYNVVDGLNQIHVLEMNRDEEPDVRVRAYISELANGQLQLYGYYIPDGTPHYFQTIQFFQKLDEEYIIPNQEYQEEQIQKELDEGNIPEEALDAFLNPTQ